MKLKENEVCCLAIENYGEDMQKIIAMEECSELIKAISKLIRKPLNPKAIDDLSEEIADVEIMILQLKMIYQIYDAVDIKREKKIQRLFNRISKGD
jgi:NTP pyrophosphatase (non-canonical NTP hydrolase)